MRYFTRGHSGARYLVVDGTLEYHINMKYLPLLLGLVSPPTVLGRIHDKARRQQQERTNVAGHRPNNFVVENNVRSVDEVEILFFDQRLDHFSDSVTATFKQRYFYSSRYAAGENATTSQLPPLAFLCVGSQGKSLDQSVLIDSNHCTGDMVVLAEKLHVEQNREVHLFSLGELYLCTAYCLSRVSLMWSY